MPEVRKEEQKKTIYSVATPVMIIIEWGRDFKVVYTWVTSKAAYISNALTIIIWFWQAIF